MNKYNDKFMVAITILWVIFCIACIVLSNDYIPLLFFILGFVTMTVLNLLINSRKDYNKRKTRMSGFWVFNIRAKDYAWQLQDETYYFKDKPSLEQLNKYVDTYGRRHVCKDDSVLLTLIENGRYIGASEKGEDVDMYLYYIEGGSIK